LNILIIDDHPLTCQGLGALLSATRSDATVQIAYSVEQAHAALERLPAPDWIFLDIHLPDDPGHRFFHMLCGTPWIDRTVLISAGADQQLIRTALSAGARGFIPKTAQPDIVLKGFHTVLSGEFYLPPEMSDLLRNYPVAAEAQRNLSPRLQQVQTYLLRGASNKVIARDLELSAHTVKEYVSSILAFHGVPSRLELVLKLNSTV
jgi:two-component system nitrate/nitrite response regulator NarL